MNAASESTIDLSECLRLVRKGQGQAYEGVVRQFERPLRAWLAAQSPPGVDVDEIAQRSFIAAYTRLQEFKEGTDFGAWLFTIAKYQLKTETTRLRRIADYQSRYAPDLLREELQGRSEETPEFWAMRLEHLRECLAGLDERLRRFMQWRYEEEIPLDEMAARCGRSVAAVKKQLWQVRQLLQRCVEQKLQGQPGATS